MAKQMNLPEGARIVERIPFGRLATGLFSKGKKVFYVVRRGGLVFHFPVFEGGTVSRCGDGSVIYPDEIVAVIDQASIGITKLAFKEE